MPMQVANHRLTSPPDRHVVDAPPNPRVNSPHTDVTALARGKRRVTGRAGNRARSTDSTLPEER